jgi:hypothetical protein
MRITKTTGLVGCLLLLALGCRGQHGRVRTDMSLDTGWRTAENDTDITAYAGFERPGYPDASWKRVDVPHNWDDYGGYRRLRNGNRYGYAWYRKRFRAPEGGTDRHYFLWFEGVGSYATVWLNGVKVGAHAGGRTSFTLEVTAAIHPGATNLLCVRADEPRHIRDLPWVSGGDSNEPGFSEGSQPLGIFRPVHLVVTGAVRIIPFGVHVWNDTTASRSRATLYLETTIRNLKTTGAGEVRVVSLLQDSSAKTVARTASTLPLPAGGKDGLCSQQVEVSYPHLWSPREPYLYTVVSEVYEKGRLVDRVRTACGIRTVSWPRRGGDGSKRFLVNGKPVYINGVAGYEHLLGGSHAFSHAQVLARVHQTEAAGFNAFRDAHQPHNLLFGHCFEKDGILWWPQFAAHIWFDNAAFRRHFKQLLHDWVVERRNNPAVILWGLENESTLPDSFARACAAMIRRLDPTASSQRLITTCNGGTGTDWNVPQNWSGTYGGDPWNYAAEVQQEGLVGEYGAWRSIDLHTEGPFREKGPLSEDRMAQLMELKVRQADSVKEDFCGQFMWLLHSHDNPGRVQSGEGYRDMDRVGPVNYKGLFTIWGEPVDAYYMYRANYVSGEKDPMVYIVSHTWPDRWTAPGMKHGITVYSNCDEVELFNDVDSCSLGVRKRGAVGTHFEWDSALIRYNVLYAVGYVKGKAVARDCIVLHHLPRAPHFAKLVDTTGLTAPAAGYHYLYRVDCGGPDYRDVHGKLWMADTHLTGSGGWGSLSWTDRYKGLPPFFASQRRTFDPIRGTADWPLLQTFRYGRRYLQYVFPVPDGDYRVELYFTEPWFGVGGAADCTGWRLFDVAANGKTMLHDVDIWKEAGTDRALKKTFNVHVTGGKLVISFPKVNACQAVISAIAIATRKEGITPAPPSPALVQDTGLVISGPRKAWSVQQWLDTGQPEFSDDSITFSALPPALYGAEWIRGPRHLPRGEGLRSFKLTAAADVYAGIDTTDGSGGKVKGKPAWLEGWAATATALENDRGRRLVLYHRSYPAGATVRVEGHPFLALKYPTAMPPTYDLKPVQHYRIAAAVKKGAGLVADKFGGRDCVTFTRWSADTLEWTIQVGIASRYDLGVRYGNAGQQVLSAKLTLISSEGRVLDSRQLSFEPAAGKWRTVNVMTSTAVNAGSYTVRLTGTSARGLHVSGLDVQ